MTEARLLFILGAAYGGRHEWTKAIQVLEESVAIGNSIQDLRQLSMVYGNLSLNYQELGQFAQAARYAHRALAIHETLRDKRMLAISENNLALLLFMQGDLANAFRHGERSLALFDDLGQETEKAHTLMTLAELELARSNHEEAERYAIGARDVAERMGVDWADRRRAGRGRCRGHRVRSCFPALRARQLFGAEGTQSCDLCRDPRTPWRPCRREPPAQAGARRPRDDRLTGRGRPHRHSLTTIGWRATAERCYLRAAVKLR